MIHSTIVTIRRGSRLAPWTFALNLAMLVLADRASWAQSSAQATCPTGDRNEYLVWNFTETTASVIDPGTIRDAIADVARDVREVDKATARAPALGPIPSSSSRACTDTGELEKVRRGDDVDSLVLARVMLGVVGENGGLHTYILPLGKGAEGRIPLRACSEPAEAATTASALTPVPETSKSKEIPARSEALETAAFVDLALERLSAHQMAAIGLYEAGRLSQKENWCRLRLASLFLARAETILSKHAANREERRLLERLREQASQLTHRLTKMPTDALVACGVSPAAAALALSRPLGRSK